jgi:hypothetical protein
MKQENNAFRAYLVFFSKCINQVLREKDEIPSKFLVQNIIHCHYLPLVGPQPKLY